MTTGSNINFARPRLTGVVRVALPVSTTSASTTAGVHAISLTEALRR